MKTTTLAAVALLLCTSCATTLAPDHPDYVAIRRAVVTMLESRGRPLRKVFGFSIRATARSARARYRVKREDLRGVTTAAPRYESRLTQADGQWRIISTKHIGY